MDLHLTRKVKKANALNFFERRKCYFCREKKIMHDFSRYFNEKVIIKKYYIMRWKIFI